jgi:nicotinate-nucleotide adenylyltransferase
MEAARRVAHHPRIAVTDFEAGAGTRFTYDTISYLKRRANTCHFVWLMGADNFIHFHRWKRWREIAELVPLAIIDRPGSTLKAAHSQAAKALEGTRLEESDALLLPYHAPPAFVFLHGPRSRLSSTALRERGQGF